MNFDSVWINWFKKDGCISLETLADINGLIKMESKFKEVKIEEKPEIQEFNIKMTYQFKAKTKEEYNKIKEKILRITNYNEICLECFKDNKSDDDCGKCKKRRVIIR